MGRLFFYNGGGLANAAVSEFRAMEGKYSYGRDNAGRLDPETSGYTDCSGAIYTAFKNACGLMPGNVSSEQACINGLIASYNRGQDIDISNLEPADIFCFYQAGTGSWGHVALYMGGNELWDQNTDWAKGPKRRTDNAATGLWDAITNKSYTRVDIVRPLPRIDVG